jgi:hypothetical protein
VIRTSTSCWRAVCRCFEKRLDDSNISAAFEQMGRKTVAQRVQAHPFPDPGQFVDFREDVPVMPMDWA